MCLHDANKLSQEGEVKCYKVLLMKNEGELSSLYYESFTWKIGETMTAEFREGVNADNILGRYGTIFSGAFHSVETLKDAKLYMENSLARNWRMPDTVIAECVIPEDNEYLYEGRATVAYDSCRCITTKSYASQKLKVLRIVPEEEYKGILTY